VPPTQVLPAVTDWSCEYIRARQEINPLPRAMGRRGVLGKGNRSWANGTADGAGRTPGAGAAQADRASARADAARRKRNRGARAALTFGTRTIELKSWNAFISTPNAA